MTESQAPVVTTLEGVGVMLWHIRSDLSEQRDRMTHMATHEDIKAIKETISKLVTRDELESLRKELDRSNPGQWLKNIVATCAGVAVVLALIALVVEGAAKADKIAAHVFGANAKE